MSDIAFTVVVPLYNKRDFVRRTVLSALNQDWLSFEIIVVDDGSTDDSVQQLADIADERLRIVSQANAGPGAARNRGISEARYEWIAFLDADDVWYPDHLREMARIIHEVPHASLVCSSQVVISGDQVPDQPPTPSSVRAISYFARAGTSPFGTSATAARRDVFERIGGFGNFRPGQDTEMWARMMLELEAATSTRITSVYVKETGGITDSATLERKRGEKRWSGNEVPPLRLLLEKALGNGQYAAKHADIRTYLDDRSIGGIRKALVEGDSLRARKLLGDVYNKVTGRYRFYRMLAAIPAPLIAYANGLRNRLRRGGLTR